MGIQNLKLNISFLQKSLFSLFFFLSISTHANEYRIISLSPAITEIIYAMDLQKYLVGASSFSDYPEEAKKIPTVGSYISPSIEKIVRLNPTHVLIFKEGDPSIGQSLKNANINFIVLDSRNLSDFESMIQKLGSTFNVEKKSQVVLNLWKSQWAMLETLPKVKKSIMIQVDHNPIFVAGGDTFISKSFERCGLKNTFSNLNGYKKIQLESVLNRTPDLILIVGMLSQADSFIQAQDFWNKNPITKKSSVVKGDGDALSRLSPRLPSAVIKACSEMARL